MIKICVFILITDYFRVTPNLREHVYCNALRHGSDAEYDFLWNKHETTNVVNEKVIILGALGCTKREGKIME